MSSLGYSEAGVCKRLKLPDLTDLLWRAVPVYREEHLARRDELALAIDLFLLQGVNCREELDRWLGHEEQALLVRAGVLAIDEEGRARARTTLYPVGERLIFSDCAWPQLLRPDCVSTRADQVMFIGSDSRWLARATVRQPVGAALDLCTGSGIHALLASAHAKRVVAVDINPRAARCASFNAQALGAKNLEVRAGDLYEPVGEEKFDLITANPPFVPSPVNTLLFRDGGCSGEEVQRRIIAGLPAHLAPGGIAQIVTEFGESEGKPFFDRVREWLGGAPMDICIHRLRERSAISYAIGHADGNDTYEAFFKSVRDWAGNLKTQGYSRIVSVLLAFRWSDAAAGAPWTRSEEAQPPRANAGLEVDAAFVKERMVRRADFHDWLESGWVCLTGPIGLLETRMLGSETGHSTQAKLLGQALPVLHGLNPVEQMVLEAVVRPMPVAELLSSSLARRPALDKEAVFAAVGSLVRNGLLQRAVPPC